MRYIRAWLAIRKHDNERATVPCQVCKYPTTLPRICEAC